MFRDDVQASFSDLWYRVVDARPRISPHARIVRQRYGPAITYIIEDPAGGHYYRLSESAYFFLGLLDGRTTVDEAWEACCTQLGDGAPSQRECLHLLAQLQLFGLLVGDQPIASDMIEHRIEQARSQRFQKRTGRFVFPSIPLINPEPFLERTGALWRLVFSRWGFAVWLVTVLLAIALVIPRSRDFASELNGILDVRNLILLSILFLLIRAVHEFGHAAACKAMGGRCTEIGVILIAMVLPLPYCDASSAWRFPELWRRVLVSGAGMLVEFFLAAIAAIVWVATDPHDAQVLHAVAFNAMILSSITTLVFNLNPLLRYDGYYILSDVLGIPNLAQRSKALWQFILERYLLGVRRNTPPPVRDRSEFWAMLIYGLLAPPYRIFIAVTILIIVATHYLTLGIVIAIVMGLIWFVWPVLKGMTYLATSPRLIGRRTRAFAVTGTGVGMLVVLLALVPFPAAGYAHGKVEPVQSVTLRAAEEGFIKAVHARPGDAITQGTLVIEMENPELQRDLRLAQLTLEQARIERDLAAQGAPATLAIADERLRMARAALQRAQDRVARLRITSPIEGRLVAPTGAGIDLENLEGRFVRKGVALARVAALDQLRVRAQMSDRQYAYVFHDPNETRPALVRVRGRAGEVTPAHVTALAGAGFRRLEDEALSIRAAGPIALDPTDPSGQRTLVPLFTIELAPEHQPDWWQPGLRAKVRFPLEPAPLATQLWRRARQFLTQRFSP